MRWWLSSDALNKGDPRMLSHKKGPVGTIKTWVQDGYSRRKLTRAWTIMDVKWYPKYKMVTHNKNQREHGQVWRQSGALSISVSSEEILFWGVVKWPFLEKMGPGEVSNNKKLMDTNLRAQWEPSNSSDGFSNWATVWLQQVKEKSGVSLLIRKFPSKFTHFHVGCG